MIAYCIENEEEVSEACEQEIIRRYFEAKLKVLVGKGTEKEVEQIKLIMDVFDILSTKHNLYKMVDPAMADNGKMYPAFTDDFALEMKKLSNKNN